MSQYVLFLFRFSMVTAASMFLIYDVTAVVPRPVFLFLAVVLMTEALFIHRNAFNAMNCDDGDMDDAGGDEQESLETQQA